MMEKLRKITIIKNPIKFADSSCIFCSGNTKVICTATINENNVPTFCEEKNSGWITAEYSMLPRSSPQRTNRNKILSSGRTHEIQRLIGRALRSIVDLEKLYKNTIIIDCDVIQADGGTRTASINGAFIVLYYALLKLYKEKKIQEIPIKEFIGAVSVGIVNNKKVLDLSYELDSNATVDMNVVMTESGKLIEVQATAEKNPISQKDFYELLNLSKTGILKIIKNIKKTCKADKN